MVRKIIVEISSTINTWVELILVNQQFQAITNQIINRLISRLLIHQLQLILQKVLTNMILISITNSWFVWNRKMLITINRNTIIKFSKRAWIAPTTEKEVTHKYSSLNRSINNLGKLKDREVQGLIMLHKFNNKQMMLEVWVLIQEHSKF